MVGSTCLMLPWPLKMVTCQDYLVATHQVVSLALPHCLGLAYWHYQLKLQLAAAVTEINDGVVLSLRSGDWWREPPRAAGRPQSIRLDVGIQLDISTQLDIGIQLDIGVQLDQMG